MTEQETRETESQAHAACAALFYEYGRPIFDVSDDLFLALMLTEQYLEGPLPFPALSIMVGGSSAVNAGVVDGVVWCFPCAQGVIANAREGTWASAEEGRRTLLLVRGVVNYINAAGGLPEKKHKYGDPPAPVERVSDNKRRWRVGRPVRLDPSIRKYAQEHVARGEPLWTVNSRFIVRGHWRNQACGEGRREHKVIWVAPFWKGPEDGVQALERKYKVVG